MCFVVDNIKYPGRHKAIASIAERGENCCITSPFEIKGAENIYIGKDFYCGANCRFETWSLYNDILYYPQILIGNNVRINSKCHIGAINKITIGNDVLIGSNVFITDHSHGRGVSEEAEIPPTNRDLYSKGEVIIEDKVWIGENVVILPGVHIGMGSIIGASAVVTKSVPAYSIAVGNPAHVVKKIC